LVRKEEEEEMGWWEGKKEERGKRIGRNRGYGGGALGARGITLILGAIRG
jgi:hypothetical protein